MIEKANSNKDYIECVKDIYRSEPVIEMNEYIQHGSTTTLEHSINVSFLSYKIAKKLKMDYKSVARAGLLHDLFLYDWHQIPKERKLLKKHGFTHSKTALDNAIKHFDLNEKEMDIILKHMWPLTFVPPVYKEGWIVTIADKWCSTLETLKIRKGHGVVKSEVEKADKAKKNGNKTGSVDFMEAKKEVKKEQTMGQRRKG